MKPHKTLDWSNGHDLINAGREFIAKTATEPIADPPGSLEKIEAMQRRVARCEECFSDADRQGFEGVDATTIKDYRETMPNQSKLVSHREQNVVCGDSYTEMSHRVRRKAL